MNQGGRTALVTAAKIVLTLALALYVSLFFAQKQNFTLVDLGRHIKNGEIVLTQANFLDRNFYSYSEPDFPTNTHHWGTGVIYYLVWKSCGFEGLSALNMVLYLAAFGLFFLASLKISRFRYVWPVALLLVPLLAARTEIRPEAFSYLFFGLYYYILTRYTKGELGRGALFSLLALQIIWVNLHIYFIFGIALVTIFLLGSLVNKNGKTKELALLLAALLPASMISPFGYKALLEPFMILKQYGYMISENQSLFFMQGRFPQEFNYLYFELITLAVAAGFILLAVKKAWKQEAPNILLGIIFIVLAYKMIRNIALCGLVLLPVASATLGAIAAKYDARKKKIFEWGSAIIAGLLLIVFSFSAGNLFNPINNAFGLGLAPGVNDSAEFYKGAGIKGPIFNNYDIGSYLIFHLFPAERVFVDNRPEAYSVKFFQDIYIPAQQKEKKWEEISRRYNFNVIYFYWHDITPWAQPFLNRRVKDPLWVPIYVDAYALILVKNNAENQSLIRRYALPRSMFTVVTK